MVGHYLSKDRQDRLDRPLDRPWLDHETSPVLIYISNFFSFFSWSSAVNTKIPLILCSSEDICIMRYPTSFSDTSVSKKCGNHAFYFSKIVLRGLLKGFGKRHALTSANLFFSPEKNAQDDKKKISNKPFLEP
jgi:hypothetical protein